MPYAPLAPRTAPVRVRSAELSLSIRIQPEDVEKFVGRLHPKLLRKAVLRSADVAVGMAVTVAGRLMDAEEPEYMVSRRKGILRDYRRWATRLRGRFDGAVARSRTMAMGGAAAALEVGGTYEQWVHGYDRMMTYSSRGETTRIARQSVGEHRRTRTERTGKHYLDRAFLKIGPVWQEPLRRAVDSVFQFGKVPPARQLRAGLMGGL